MDKALEAKVNEVLNDDDVMSSIVREAIERRAEELFEGSDGQDLLMSALKRIVATDRFVDATVDQILEYADIEDYLDWDYIITPIQHKITDLVRKLAERNL